MKEWTRKPWPSTPLFSRSLLASASIDGRRSPLWCRALLRRAAKLTYHFDNLRNAAWPLIAGAVLLIQAFGILHDLQPAPFQIKDFFQEWASARNYLTGLPIYTKHEMTLPRYLGWERDPNEVLFVEVNAHPPPSVLLAIPLAGLDYRHAQLAWNLVSLFAYLAGVWLVFRQLRLPLSFWFLSPLVLFFLSEPARQQVVQGQLSFLLFLLIAGTWAADRNGQSKWAGIWLGLATAVKLFPGLLFLFFILRRQWKTVLTGAGCFLAVTMSTAVILGPQAYRSYLCDVSPQVAEWRSVAHNNSIPGLWCKLFDPGAKSPQIQPIAQAPAVAKMGTALSCTAVLLLLALVTTRAESLASQDLAFSMTVVAMMLLAPVAWGHYLVLLLLPLALVWVHLPSSGWLRGAFWGIVIVLAIKPIHLWHLCGLWDWRTATVTPWNSLTALSAQLYAILVLLILCTAMSCQLGILGRRTR